VRFVAELPKTATGKMWKAEIKRRMREGGEA
jgi:acyl-coenzyme A synthetase/AMP-(fatty) acid ligase